MWCCGDEVREQDLARKSLEPIAAEDGF